MNRYSIWRRFHSESLVFFNDNHAPYCNVGRRFLPSLSLLQLMGDHSVDHRFQNACFNWSISSNLGRRDSFFELAALVYLWYGSLLNADISNGSLDIGVNEREFNTAPISKIAVSDSWYVSDTESTLWIRRCFADFTAASHPSRPK